MTTLSICRVTNALYPDVIGGHAIFCHEVSARQAALGYRVRVFTCRTKNLPRHQAVEKGYDIIRLDRVWMPWDSMGMSNPVTPSLYGAVRGSKTDIVDAHSPLFWTTALAVKAAVDEGLPAITTVHGIIALRDWFRTLSQRIYLHSVASWVLRSSSKVVCLTQSDANEVAGFGVQRDNIEVIPVAVDLSLFVPAKETRGIVLWVGRLVPEKGLDILLRSVSILRGRRNIHAVIVGDGPERSSLTRLAKRLNILDSVDFRLRADRSEIADLLQTSGVFVLTSLKEGLPLALLEAMASGNAVVASDLPSIRETLADAGLYFREGDPAALAEVLVKVLDDRDLRKRMGKRAREIVEARFAWTTVLSKLQALYSEIVN